MTARPAQSPPVSIAASPALSPRATRVARLMAELLTRRTMMKVPDVSKNMILVNKMSYLVALHKILLVGETFSNNGSLNISYL